MVAVVTGSVSFGFEAYGPFERRRDALKWIDEKQQQYSIDHTATVLELQKPNSLR